MYDGSVLPPLVCVFDGLQCSMFLAGNDLDIGYCLDS